LKLVDGWILERRAEGLTFDADVFAEVFSYQGEQVATVKVASSSSKSKLVSSAHRRLLPKSTTSFTKISRGRDRPCGRSRISAMNNECIQGTETNSLLRKLDDLEDDIFMMSTHLVEVSENLLKTRGAIQEIRLGMYIHIGIIMLCTYIFSKSFILHAEFIRSMRSDEQKTVDRASEVSAAPQDQGRFMTEDFDEKVADVDTSGCIGHTAIESTTTTEESSDPLAGGATSVRQLREKYFQSKITAEGKE